MQEQILRTLLYYDIWKYPLTKEELFCFLPVNGMSFSQFCTVLNTSGPGPDVAETRGYYFLRNQPVSVVDQRLEREANAQALWRIARISMHLIKRFPFVRGVFVSGDLSKNATTPESDIDFYLVTAPNRVWICRTLLILFKKVFLLNNKKYFCLNFFSSSDHLEIKERNMFVATEVAHLKPLYNETLFHSYLDANQWMRRLFPNFDLATLRQPVPDNRRSYFQLIIESIFRLLPSDAIDRFLMNRMRKVWATRYPAYDEPTRDRIFRSTRNESRAYAGNYQDKILDLYRSGLREHGLEQTEQQMGTTASA